MVQTRALPAAGRGRGRPPLGRGRGRIPAAGPRAAEEVQIEIAVRAAPEMGEGTAGGQGPQRVQSADSDHVSMEGPTFRDYIRRVEEAARAGRRAPDLPAQKGPAGRSNTVTQVPAAPAPAVVIARATEEHRGPRPDTWLKAFHQMGVPPFSGKVGLEVELWIGHVDSALESIRCLEDR